MEFGYEQNLLDGKFLNHKISLKFYVKVSVRSCQMIFHSLELRKRKPMPFISKGDPEKQEALKKLLKT